ncbi:MAG: HDIG domain-containing protein [Parachlamydiaceae bacterium]|nr:HDIG domain-containing protein [Parachlamydiaceae bacterium]
MNERTSEIENSHELKFSREQGFFDRNLGIRIAISILFIIALFLVLHFRETRVEVLELNSIAPNYVVAQIDFDFLDEEATVIFRQEAVRDIGKIYRVQDKEIRQRHMEFENFLIYNQEWRKSVESSAFEEMYSGATSLEKSMIQLRFTDPRTLQIMRDVGIPTSDYVIYTPSDTSTEVTLPQQIWRYLNDNALPKNAYHTAAKNFIISYFQNRTWTIDEDIPAQRMLRKKVQAAISDRYTHVGAGSRLVDQGEKVTTRHIAMLQAMKKALNDSRNLWHPLTLAGSLLLALLFAGICLVYLYSNHPQILTSNRKLSLLISIFILTLMIAKGTEFIIINAQSNIIDLIRYPVFVAFAAILICSLMNSNVATFATGFLTLVLTIALSFERQGFMIINLTAALIAILSARSLRQRKEIFVVCAKAWVVCVFVIFSLYFSQNILWSSSVLSDIISTAIFMLLTAIAVVGMLPLLESTFRVMTDVTLTEYLDPNNDLLRRLTIEAPGTYQHSVVVGNIAETAAVAIGANGLFCRVATLYHDVGKMATPQYFTENQQGGMNIHQLLTPQESAAVIIAHVKEGVGMARKAGLPEPFIDVIKEHHGTTLVYYFYRKQLEKMQGDRSRVNEADFRYAGPKPRSKESAIIMIADTLEAASRSLDTLDEKSLKELADRLLREKGEDGQFDNCLLTLEELATVKASLIKTLIAFGHSRIKYPKREVPPENTPVTLEG